jgi:hypothetical protein
MPSSLNPLPPSEWRLMVLLWRRGPSTVNELLELTPEYSVTTVATFLRRLVSKGYLRTTLEPPPLGGGRPPERFHPRVDYRTGLEIAIQKFLSDYLPDDAEGLIRLAEAAEERLSGVQETGTPRPATAQRKRRTAS